MCRIEHAYVVQAFKGKRPSTIPGLKGLAHSPHLVEADFGVKLTQIPALRIGAKHRSDPQEVLEGLQELWNDCDSYMPFVRLVELHSLFTFCGNTMQHVQKCMCHRIDYQTLYTKTSARLPSCFRPPVCDDEAWSPAKCFVVLSHCAGLAVL